MTDRIAFSLRPADLADVATALRPHNWGRYERLRLVCAGAILSLLAYVLFARFALREHDVFLLNWRDAGLFAAVGALIGWLYGKRRPGANDPRLAERSFTLGDEGFETMASGLATKVDWRAVNEVADRGSMIFLVTEWGESYFVPKRVFRTPADAQAFLKRAEALRASRWAATASGGSPRYKLSWNMERSDLLAFAALKRELRGGWAVAMLFLLPMAAGIGLSWLRDESPFVASLVDDTMIGLITLLLLALAILYLVFTYVRRLLRNARVRRAALPVGETRLVADARGVEVIAGTRVERHGWKDIPAVTLDTGHVFLMTERDRAVIVPRRAFADRPAMIEFHNFAEEASKHAEA